jgi:hypothetical protein
MQSHALLSFSGGIIMAGGKGSGVRGGNGKVSGRRKKTRKLPFLMPNVEIIRRTPEKGEEAYRVEKTERFTDDGRLTIADLTIYVPFVDRADVLQKHTNLVYFKDGDDTKYIPAFWLDQRKVKFLALLAESYSVTASARSVGVQRATIAKWTAEDQLFAMAVEDAKEQAADLIEDEIRRRGIEMASDQMLAMLARAARPWKFADYAMRYDANVPEETKQLLEKMGQAFQEATPKDDNVSGSVDS